MPPLPARAPSGAPWPADSVPGTGQPSTTENGTDERGRDRLDGFPHDSRAARRQDTVTSRPAPGAQDVPGPVPAKPVRLSARQLRDAEIAAASVELNALLERTGTALTAELRMRVGPNGGPVYSQHFELVSR